MTCVDYPDAGIEQRLRSIERIQGYPMVSDSLILALSYYQWIKSKNSIIDSSLTKIERTLKSVKDVTEPIAAQRLSFIDSTMVNQLERLERMCPIILEPKESRQSLSSDIYRNTIEPSLRTVIWPLTKTIDVVSKTSYATVFSMSAAIESSMKRILPSPMSMKERTHAILDKTEELVEKDIVEDVEDVEEPSIDVAHDGISTKVWRLSWKTQRRLYRMAINEIEVLQKLSVTKLAQLQGIMKEIQFKRAPFKDRVVEGCESEAETACLATVADPAAGLIPQASLQIEQLQDIVAAVASVKKYATTNTLVSLHFINSNLSLLKTVLKVNENILHQTVNVIDRIQSVIEYVMNKIKGYLKAQRTKEGRHHRRRVSFVFDDSDDEC